MNVRTLRVQGALIASTRRADVETLAGLLREYENPIEMASICLAIFECDAAIATYAIRYALDDEPKWVARTFERRMRDGLHVDAVSMLIDRLLAVAARQRIPEPTHG